VVGIGGPGGVAALALAAAGVGRLHCVDPDVVELSNLSRQVLYTEDDIGVAKVDAGYHGPLVQVGVYVPGEGACWECLHDSSRERQIADGANPYDAPERGTAVASAVGAVPAGISGYLAAHQVIALVTGVPPAEPGVIQAVNLAALDTPFTYRDRPYHPCPACGGRPGS
jgi:molybdopterin/thiamine biosynthesis adenylyltransferase